jgi:flagellar biosynthesis protein FlhF
MHVKRFTAPDMARAMRMVRQELGPDAVILATGRLPGGGVEISAAIDMNPAPPADHEDSPPTAGPTDKGGEKRPEAPQAEAPATAQAGGGASEEKIEALVDRVESLNRALAKHLMRSEAARLFSDRPEVTPIYQHLKRMEISPATIIQLLDGLKGQGIMPRLSIRIKQQINVSGPPKVAKGSPSVLALVGPTGVGKTTTVAKLAATFSLKHRLSVGMITVDTFRMAAAEQLDTYGRIMEVPTLVAGDRTEVDHALKELKDQDIILIDTVGRAPGDAENLAELEKVLSGVQGMETHLVLASPTRDADQKQVIKAFDRFTPDRLIFTKLDESDIYGPMLNRMIETGLAVSYLTFGQKVPDDLEEATRDGLARRFMPTRKDLEQQ